MTFNDMLASFVAKGASDIHLHAGLYPMARLSGRLVPVGDTKLSPTATESLVDIMCDDRQKAIFADKYQVDLAYSVRGVARFRVNLFRQRSSVSAVLRVLTRGHLFCWVALPCYEFRGSSSAEICSS